MELQFRQVNIISQAAKILIILDDVKVKLQLLIKLIINRSSKRVRVVCITKEIHITMIIEDKQTCNAMMMLLVVK